MNYQPICEQVYETIMKARKAGLIRLSAGNISARTADGFVAITPTSIDYDILHPADIAIVDLDGKLVDAPRKPSSETAMHTALLKRFPEVGAICHTHSPYAITFSTQNRDVPAVTLELLVCGAPIPVARWARPGSPDMSVAILEKLERRSNCKVCLMRNHGLVALGKDLDNAFELAFNAEVGMQIYHQALQLGEPNVISTEMAASIHGV